MGLAGLTRTVGVAVSVGSTVVASVSLSVQAAITATGSMARTTTVGDHLKNANIAHSL